MDQLKCIFCSIVEGELPSTNIYSDDHCIAFNDINPVANVHVLVIPREHITYLTETTKRYEKLLGHLMRVAAKVAEHLGTAKDGYRVSVNQGINAGQIVDHLHLHVLGGEQLNSL